MSVQYKIIKELKKGIYNLSEVERMAGLPKSKLRKVVNGRRTLTYIELENVYSVLNRHGTELQILLIECYDKLIRTDT